MQKILPSFLNLISYLLAVVLSIKSLREPDLWWQIRTGEWILEHRQVPVTDVFSFSNYGSDWINIKWGFEVLVALLSRWFGPESVFLLQILVSVLILFYLKRILKLYNLNTPALFFVASVLLLFGIEYRMIGRPEMFSHLFVMVFAYLLLKNHEQKSNRVYLLIPIQILWCNMHEAYGIGIVMVFIFATVGWIKSVFFKTEKPVQLTLISFLCMLSTLLNPRGLLLLGRPFNIFGQVQQNKYTTELDSFLSIDYWHRESWYFVVISLVVLGFLFKTYKPALKSPSKAVLPLEYLAICAAFFVLALTAYRNIVFFLICIIPLLIFIIQKYLNPVRYSTILAVTGILFYAIIVSGQYYKTFRPRDRYGMEILSTHNPVGAANYIKQRGLSTKKCFSDYLVSSYLLWDLQPDFKTFIDLRDLDIFSTSFFDRYLAIINDPKEFHTLDEKENFQYVVLYRGSNEALHRYLYNDSIYACTFADPVAAVYEKTDEFKRGDIFQNCMAVEPHALPFAINTVFYPFYRKFDYEEANFDFEAASYYLNVGLISAAEKRVNRFLLVNPQSEAAIQLKSEIMNIKDRIKP